jgi:hypothetical protein
MTYLEELNELLNNSELDLPSFRKVVDRSGSNLPWLKKHVGKNQKANDRLKYLIGLDLKTLLEESK